MLHHRTKGTPSTRSLDCMDLLIGCLNSAVAWYQVTWAAAAQAVHSAGVSSALTWPNKSDL